MGALGFFTLPLLVTIGCGINPDTSSDEGPRAAGGQVITRTASASLVITPGREESQRLARVEVLPQEIVVLGGQPFIFIARAFDAEGKAMFNVNVRWQSADPSSGTINDRGYFRAGSKPGRYNNVIRVEATQRSGGQDSKQVAYATVTIATAIVETPIVRVDVVPQEITLTPGQPFVFNALSYDAFGSAVPTVQYKWESQVAVAGSINSFGLFRASETPGRYENVIKVTARQTLQGQLVQRESFATVIVLLRQKDAPLARVEISPPEASVASGQALAFVALAYDGQNRPLLGVRFRWRVQDGAAGTINSLGFFFAKGEPKSYPNAIRVEAVQSIDSERVTGVAFASVTVTTPTKGTRLERVTIVPQEITINPGRLFNFSAVAYDGSNRPVSGVQFVWSLEQPNIGSVSRTGLFRAAKPGRHMGGIKVEAIQVVDGTEVRRESYANVIIPGPMSRVDIVPSTAKVASRDLFYFSAIAYDENDIAIPGVSYTWRMLDARAGTVNRVGVFKAGDVTGEYPRAVEVEVRQVYPTVP